MYFGTKGNATMTEVVEKVEDLGFNSSLGPVDIVYKWDN
jgi:hypothetical protein